MSTKTIKCSVLLLATNNMLMLTRDFNPPSTFYFGGIIFLPRSADLNKVCHYISVKEEFLLFSLSIFVVHLSWSLQGPKII